MFKEGLALECEADPIADAGRAAEFDGERGSLQLFSPSDNSF
jgi:hypothetical protein